MAKERKHSNTRVTFTKPFRQNVLKHLKDNPDIVTNHLVQELGIKAIFNWVSEASKAPREAKKTDATVITKASKGSLLETLQEQKKALLNKLELISQCEALGLKTSM